MLIFIEGCDGTGKTELANHIKQKIGFEIVKFSQPKKEAYIEYMEFLTTRDISAICDRSYLGEEVYGPIKRGKSGLNYWQFRNIEMLASMRSPLAIYCETDEKEIEKTFNTRGENFTKKEEIHQVLEGYHKAISKSMIDWKIYNYLDDPNYEAIDRIIEDWASKKYFANPDDKLLIQSRAIGNFDSKVMLLGDVSNIDLEQDKYKHINVPFANGPSSTVLYAALGADPNRVIITNVNKLGESQGVDINSELYKLPNVKVIVCLGHNAYNNLLELSKTWNNRIGIKVVKVPHPAYVARGGISQNEYGKLLNEAITI
jgi:thymidylate kinase